ncbi:hypothetical protein [Lysobacter gummosus]|uniref:hypothetical protein n=1 Tax=Lysobacter gummosus TaxID=262324 RepID=UPI00362C2780
MRRGGELSRRSAPALVRAMGIASLLHPSRHCDLHRQRSDTKAEALAAEFGQPSRIGQALFSFRHRRPPPRKRPRRPFHFDNPT